MSKTSPEAHGLSSERLDTVERVCAEYVERGEVVGALASVVRHGEHLYTTVAGQRDRENDLPMTEDTIFRIFSMTKPITAVATMILLEEGRLRLTDPVSRFFPGFREMSVYQSGTKPPFETDEAKREITVRDLLTHTAGLAYGLGDPHPAEENFRKRVWDLLIADPSLGLDFFAETVAEQPLVHQPGEAWRYSASFDLLAAVVQRASGHSFADFIGERITGPLGMADTGFTVRQLQRHRLAALYQLQDDGTLGLGEDPPIMAFHTPRSHPNGGGGLLSTAGDYLRFCRMLLGGGELDGTRILGARTVELLTRNHLRDTTRTRDRDGRGFNLGMEVITDLTGYTSYGRLGTYGWGGAATTRFWIDPADELIILVMTQLFPGFSRPICEDIRTAVYQAIVE